MKPKRARPATMQIPPARIESMPASTMASSGSPAASGTIVAAISGASDESGPSTRIRLGPKMAYATSGTMVAYSPVIGGSPDASA